MRISLSERFSIEKGLIYILIVALIIVFGFIFYLGFSQLNKGIKIFSPLGGEEWKAGQSYRITWQAKRIDKVGIVLFKSDKPEWIVRDIPAKQGSYEWKIYIDQQYGGDYWIAVVEYPWREGNQVAYSKGSFSIIYPELTTCDEISVENNWPYLPSKFPNLRRVFITDSVFTGNLGGLSGADQKCQQEAENQGFGGKWQVFIGGDKKEETAVERLNTVSRKTEGIFIEAKSAATLSSGGTCHRLLGKDFSDFLSKFSVPSAINQIKLGDDLLQNFGKIWLGRINENSLENCITVAASFSNPYTPLAEKYSFTATCQNWIKDSKTVDGYPVPRDSIKPNFPTCYTAQGGHTDAVMMAGLASGLAGSSFSPAQGKTCDTKQRLLCIEE